MRIFKYTSSILMLFIILMSCTKVIQVDLNSVDPKYVIKAAIIEGQSDHFVTITRSLNFDQATTFPTVNNAVVTVTDDLGQSATFQSIGDGRYQVSNYLGVTGRNYTITVQVDGEIFTASCSMPTTVLIDSLFQQNYLFGPDTLYGVIPAHFDPANESNYYQFKVDINNEPFNQVILSTDQFTNGNLDVQPLFLPLEVGDNVRVEMLSITKPVWTYLNQLALNNSQQTTPANPISNFSGGCLGYFSAHGRDIKVITIQ
jgi:hypothetical protein